MMKPPQLCLLRATQSAQNRMHTLLERENPRPKGFILSVKPYGCAGFGYQLNYLFETNPTHTIVTIDDLLIMIPQSALFYLIGTEIDYVEDPLSSRFVFNNPNQVGRCGCGESVLIEPKQIESD